MRKAILLTAISIMSALAIHAQVLTSTSPSSASQGSQNLPITISGLGTSFVGGSATYVYFGQGSSSYYLSSTNVTINSSTNLTAYFDIPFSQPAGTYDVTVDNGGNTVTGAIFSILAGQAPQIVTVDTNYAAVGTTLDVTITGLGTHFSQGSNTSVYFSQGSNTYISSLQTTVNSPTSLTATMAVNWGLPFGFYDVNVYDSFDGYVTLPNGFVVTDTAAGIVVVNGIDTTGVDSTTLRIIGNGTHFGTGGSTTTVWLGNVNRSQVSNALSTSVNIVNSNELVATFRFPSGSPAGWYDVFVLNSLDGQLTKSHAFYKTGITAVNDISADLVSIFPNPVKDLLNVNINASLINSTYTFTDLTGRTVRNGTLNTKNTTISLSGLSQGLYLLHVGGESYKIVKE
jgi:hypothetical protein